MDPLPEAFCQACLEAVSVSRLVVFGSSMG